MSEVIEKKQCRVNRANALKKFRKNKNSHSGNDNDHVDETLDITSVEYDLLARYNTEKIMPEFEQTPTNLIGRQIDFSELNDKIVASNDDNNKNEMENLDVLEVGGTWQQLRGAAPSEMITKRQ